MERKKMKKTRNKKGRSLLITIVVLSVILILMPVIAVGEITAARDISKQTVAPGKTFTVTVTITATQTIYAPILDEDLPTNWTVTPLQNDGATFKESEIKWLWMESLSEGDSRTVVYNVTVPSDAESGLYYITGGISAYQIPCIDVDGESKINVSWPCGNMNVNPTSWSPPTINCGDSDSQIVTVSATGGVVEGVTVSKISGETWLTLSQTNLGDIPSGSSKTFTMTAAPPAGTSSGDYPYTFRVSNTCGTPSSRDVTGTITVRCPELSYSPTSHDFGDKCEGVTDSTTFEIWNSGTGTLTYTLSETCSWADVNPASGSSTGGHNRITVDIDTTGLSEGSHTCDISINSNDGTGTFTVTVNVVPCPESSWTYMVYLDGDNNLEGAAINDFMEMSAVGSTSDVNIVVQFDRIPGYVSSYGDWTDCKRFHVTSGMTPTAANATEDLGECNMGDPNTLRDFVTWAMTNFSADNYALTLWNHGDGWKSINNWVPWADDLRDAKDAGSSRGICVDNTNNDYLSLQETEAALTGKYVQLLGYDACLMHMVEVVYQVMANAGVSVGSEELEPWDGWPYDTILADLTGTPTMNEDALGTVIVDRYMEYYGYAGTETQSAVDNSVFSSLVAAVDNLAQALINEINAGHVADVQEARYAAEEIYYTYYIDLYHFAEMVDTYVPGAAAEAQAVMNEVSKMYEAHGSSVPNDHGLSIYCPRVEGDYLASYDNTAFAVDTQWDEFLKKYYHPPPAQGEDIGVFRAGLWILPPNYRFNFGMSTDIPITGDWNGNGVDTIGVRRGRQWILSNSNAAPSVAYRVNWAMSTDIQITGDWNGNGVDTIGVRRGRQWILSNSNTAPSVAYRVNYGMSTDIPVVGDWNGDGVDTIGVRRGRQWILSNSNTAPSVAYRVNYGSSTDIPVVGDWNGDGVDTIGVRRGRQWILSNSNTAPVVAYRFNWGLATDEPVTGDWI